MSDKSLILYFLIFVFLSFGCSRQKAVFDVDVSDIRIENVKIKRYGEAIFNLDTSNLRQELQKIKKEYPLFLNGDFDNPRNLQRMYDFLADPKLRKAYRETSEYFNDLNWLEEDLKKMFRYLRYYFPDIPIPVVYTYVSGYDYEFRTQYYSNNLIIALDMYLGEDYTVYKQLGLPLYVLRKFSKDYITRDCAFEIAGSFLDLRNVGNKLLDNMVREGKYLYIVKALKPDLNETILFDYTAQQMEWIRQNEQLVWAFIIEQEMLYSTDPDHIKKLIEESPFTSYFGADSPPRLGNYIGYRMVKAYMENMGTSDLKSLIRTDAQNILRESKYKPD